MKTHFRNFEALMPILFLALGVSPVFAHYDPSLGRWLNRDPLSEARGINLYEMARNNAAFWIDRNGLDVWIEGPSGEEPYGHQSICVGDPKGDYKAWSFGKDEGFTLSGSVYADTDKGGPIEQCKKTTPDQDKAMTEKLDAELDKKGVYGWDDICRSWSQRKFKEAPGTPVTPPARSPATHNPPGPSPSSGKSSNSTSKKTCSTSGTGTSR